MTLARAWHEGNGFPPEIRGLFTASADSHVQNVEALLTIPEYQVPLPHGVRASQTDVFVLAKTTMGLMTIAVEGKVDEPFGPTIAERQQDGSGGVATRIDYLKDCLELSEVPGSCRYQLLHRTASALLTAKQFCAKTAVMLVHSSVLPTDGLTTSLLLPSSSKSGHSESDVCYQLVRGVVSSFILDGAKETNDFGKPYPQNP